LDGVVADVILFVHQDVYLPAPSISRILAGIRKIEKKDSNWGLIGIIGLDRSNGLVGEVWDPRGRIGVLTGGYSEVVAMDELVLVMRTAAGLRFDPRLPAFHLYAADMIQIAATRGMKSYVVDCPVVHNSPVHGYLGPTWAESYRYMQTKWWGAAADRDLDYACDEDRTPAPEILVAGDETENAAARTYEQLGN